MPAKVYPNVDGQRARAWVVCKKCNNAKHRIFPGDETPWWWCQDTKSQLKRDQDIEIEYIEEENTYAS